MTPRGVSAAERVRAQEEAAAWAARQRGRRILAVVVVVLGLLAIGATTGMRLWEARRAPVATAGSPDPHGPQRIVEGEPLRLGRASAAHVVELWEDAHCPHCATLESRLGPTLTRAVHEGRVRLELHPVAFIDEGSGRASALLACAAEQGVALSVHEAVWANPRSRWTAEQVDAVARQAAGDRADAVVACAAAGTHAGWVATLTDRMEAAGVSGTPTLRLDGADVDPAIDPTALEDRLR